MGTTIEKLTKILETKEAIRTAINNKGGTLTESDAFSSYSTAIDNIQTGGGENPLQYIIGNQGGDGVPSCYYLFYHYRGTSLDNALSTIDTSNVTNMSYMFYYCNNLTSIPLLNTSNVTNMSYMFYYCNNLTSIPQLDTSNVTNMSYMFYRCDNLSSIPLLNTSNVTNMSYMFYYCNNLTSIPLLDTSNVTNVSYMFYRCYNLSSIPLLDTSNVTNMSGMFDSCISLTSIPQLDTSNVTNMSGMFDGCNKLQQIHMTGMKVSFDIHYSTLFTREALVEILNNLTTVTSTQTLTMGSTNLAKLNDEDKAIATNKGWTLA